MLVIRAEPPERDRLRNAVKNSTAEELTAWLESMADEPWLWVEIEALVHSRKPEDRILVGRLRLAYLKCLCPCDSRNVWPSKKRHGLLAGVAATFRGAELVPLIAKMDHSWGWNPRPGMGERVAPPPFDVKLRERLARQEGDQ